MKLKYVSWLPTVIMMGVIFYFSSKPADNSNESSLPIAKSILSVYENITNVQYQNDLRIEILGAINHIVRKGAHFCEYAFFAVTIAFHLFVLKRKRKWLFLLPIIISALYASTDEYHQTMVFGRSGQIGDVLLDTAGAATGTLIFGLIMAICIFKSKRKHEKAATAQQ